MDYALCIDASANTPVIQQIERDFDAHCVGSSPFMGDLLALFEQRRDISREEVARIWLGTESEEEGEAVQARAILQGMTSEVFAHAGEEERAVISLTLPAAPGARRNVRRLLGPLASGEGEAESKVSPVQLVRYVEEHHGVPLMRIDENKRELWLGFKGEIRQLNQPLAPPDEVDAALASIEEYINTVDLGECPDRVFAKASMWEALLYILSAPFTDEQMRERRRHYGSVNRRGPRFLYLYGPSHNGKTTFLRYALKLITGELVDPFNADWFTKPHVRGAQAVGTCYPLLFDDLTTPTSKTFQDITKSHWESHWSNDAVFPQLVFTSNVTSLRDWAKSRIKRIDFDVHYVPTD